MPRCAPQRLVAPAAALLVLAVGAAPAPAQKLRQPSAGSALKQLVSQTDKLPSSATSKKQKAKLRNAAAAARRNARKSPCASVRQLATFRRTLGRIKTKKGRRNRRGNNRLKTLGPTSLAASRALLASRRTRRCGGGVRPSKLEEARTTILQNDANGMKLRVRLPALRFVEAEGGGRTWTRLVLPKTDTPSEPGSPGIPVVAKTLGVPEGATLKVDATRTSSYTIDGVDVFPAQPPAMDVRPDLPRDQFASPPFLLDPRDYRKRGNQPAEPADGTILGRSRDITLGNLQIPAAQYDAPRKRLKVLNSVDVTVTFEGGSHTFSDQLESPWEGPQRRLRAGLINAEVIRAGGPRFYERCGEEMLVITNPSTLPAANTFANAKRAQGMRTTVVQTGAGGGFAGTTPTEIQSFIRSRLTASGCIHPSYVTILGDDELVPVFPGIGGIESDLEYSLRDGADELPDVAVGRIAANDLAGVTTAVNKIVAYENGPPGGDWLKKATIAAEFQNDEGPGDSIEDRTFVLFSEVARSGILNTPFGVGLSVDRIYATYPPNSATVDPRYFNDGTPLPAELRKPTFAWNGDTADITAAWNDGRYLMVHRDHGAPTYWDNPYFGNGEVFATTNGAELPVVLSINCSSGAFQDSDQAWGTQALVNPNGGAVGVFGDTEVSPTWHNTQIAWGFLDALLPRVLGAEGPATKQRVGDALIHGKNRLAGIAPPAGDGATRAELYLWHYLGDPSMQMWGGDPVRVPLPSDFEVRYIPDFPPRPDPPPYGVEVTLPAEFNGQAFSLLRNGEVVGKGIAADGKAQVPAAFDDRQPKPGELKVAFEGDGAVPVTIPVNGVPPQPTELKMSCPSSVGSNQPATVSGSLSPDVAGAKVELTYTSPNGRSGSHARTVTTDAQGNWTDTFDTGPANDGQGGPIGGVWTVSARYPGDADHEGSGPTECKFSEASS